MIGSCVVSTNGQPCPTGPPPTGQGNCWVYKTVMLATPINVITSQFYIAKGATEWQSHPDSFNTTAINQSSATVESWGVGETKTVGGGPIQMSWGGTTSYTKGLQLETQKSVPGLASAAQDIQFYTKMTHFFTEWGCFKPDYPTKWIGMLYNDPPIHGMLYWNCTGINPGPNNSVPVETAAQARACPAQALDQTAYPVSETQSGKTNYGWDTNPAIAQWYRSQMIEVQTNYALNVDIVHSDSTTNSFGWDISNPVTSVSIDGVKDILSFGGTTNISFGKSSTNGSTNNYSVDHSFYFVAPPGSNSNTCGFVGDAAPTPNTPDLLSAGTKYYAFVLTNQMGPC